VLVLDTHDTTTPLSGKVGVIVELGLEHALELLEIDLVLTADLGEGDASGGLHVAELAEVGLAADEAEGNTLLTAESGKVDNHLDGVNVVGNNDHLGLVLLDEGGHVVETELKKDGLLTLVATSTAGTSLSESLKTLNLLLLAFGRVLSEELKKLGSVVLLESLAELVDGGGHLQSLHEDSLLTLDADVARPSDKAGKVALGLNISSKTEVASILLEERAGSGAGTTSTSLGLDDLLSLSFLHHND